MKRPHTSRGPPIPIANINSERGLPLREITAVVLREWWGAEVERRELSHKAGFEYLNTLAAVFGYARDLGLVETIPVRDTREMLRRRMGTQKGRAENDPTKHVRPIEAPADIDRLVDASQEEGQAPHVFVLLGLDAGLRLGEIIGLRWGSIVWGDDDDDPLRMLEITEARPRGGKAGPTKSGRSRRVALSRRLRTSLLALYRDRFEPSPKAFVLEGVDPSNFWKLLGMPMLR